MYDPVMRPPLNIVPATAAETEAQTTETIVTSWCLIPGTPDAGKAADAALRGVRHDLAGLGRSGHGIPLAAKILSVEVIEVGQAGDDGRIPVDVRVTWAQA